MAKLTARQKRFVEQYLIDLNATAAAKRAGYSEKTANEQGSRLTCSHKWARRIEGGSPPLEHPHSDRCPECGSQYFKWTNYETQRDQNKRGYGHD